MKSVLVYALVFLTIAHATVFAQPPQHADAWREFAERLPGGDFVSVRLASGKSVNGHFVSLTGDAIRIQPKTRIPVPLRTIAFDDIHSITREKEGMSPGTKVAMGVGIGAGAIMAFSFLAFLALAD